MIIPFLAIFAYLFSAIYSTHQIHKGIYYNDKALLKEYIEWNQLRENLKDYMKSDLINITIEMNLGKKNFSCYTMDLTKKYLEINSDYRT